jgi:hypothetical protein
VTTNSKHSRHFTIVLLSGLLAATISLFEPLKSAVWNWSELSLGFSGLLAKLALPFLAFWLTITALSSIAIVPFSRRTISVLVALCVSLWAQGNLFVWNYGHFDGSPISWSLYTVKGIYEIAFWATAIVFSIAKSAWVAPRARRIAAIVLALQLTALAAQIFQNAPFPTKPELPQHPASVQDVSLFSRERNVIIIVLDGLQADFFSEAMRDPEIAASMPPGFTHYRNATTLYLRTEESLLSILISRPIPDGVRKGAWLTEQMPKALPAKLSENGFTGIVTTFSPLLKPKDPSWGYERIQNVTIGAAGSADAAWRKEVSGIFAVGIFRLAPHFAKKNVYYDGQWRIPQLYAVPTLWDDGPRIIEESRTDLATFHQLIESTAAGAASPQFRFLHLYGTHTATISADCERRGKGKRRRIAVSTAKCVLSRTYDFLHGLDEVGVYDQSLIFVVADHGAKKIPIDVSAADPMIPDQSDHDSGSESDQPPITWHGRGVPVFLAKPFGDRKELRASDAPVSLCDIPSSVFDALGTESSFACESIFTLRDSRENPRIVYTQHLPKKSRENIGLPTETPDQKNESYSVIGHSWLGESWSQLER